MNGIVKFHLHPYPQSTQNIPLWTGVKGRFITTDITIPCIYLYLINSSSLTPHQSHRVTFERSYRFTSLSKSHSQFDISLKKSRKFTYDSGLCRRRASTFHATRKADNEREDKLHALFSPTKKGNFFSLFLSFTVCSPSFPQPRLTNESYSKLTLLLCRLFNIAYISYYEKRWELVREKVIHGGEAGAVTITAAAQSFPSSNLILTLTLKTRTGKSDKTF